MDKYKLVVKSWDNYCQLLTPESKLMAKLSDGTLATIFDLLRQLADAIELSSAKEWIFFERYGETSRTIGELEELQNARDRKSVV